MPADTPRSHFAARGRGFDRIAAGAVAVSAIWLALVGAYAAGFFAWAEAPARPAALTALLFVLAAVCPLALFAFSALMLRRAETLGADVAALRSALAGRDGAAPARAEPASPAADAARAGSDHAKALAARLDAIEARLDLILEAAGASGPAAAKPIAPRRPPPAPGQAALPFAEAAPPPPARLSWDDVARALDFPRDQHDREGFAALEAALGDPEIRGLLQAAEDVLAILASIGVHMEDLRPDPPSLEAWAAYAEGARGPRAAAIGGVRDPAALEATRDRARADPVFRDAGLVFTRRWNGLVARVHRELGADRTMLRVADTRSGRAFMLVARALGAFD